MIKVKNEIKLRKIIEKRYKESLENNTYTIDVGDIDVSNVKNMSALFSDCPRLQSIKGLETWDVSNVEKMESMFWGCKKLEDISGLKNWDVSNVKKMGCMFYNTKVPYRDLKELQQEYEEDGYHM